MDSTEPKSNEVITIEPVLINNDNVPVGRSTGKVNFFLNDIFLIFFFRL